MLNSFLKCSKYPCDLCTFSILHTCSLVLGYGLSKPVLSNVTPNPGLYYNSNNYKYDNPSHICLRVR